MNARYAHARNPDAVSTAPWRARCALCLALALLTTGCTTPGKAKQQLTANLQAKSEQLKSEMAAAGGRFLGVASNDQGYGYFVMLSEPRVGYAILWKADANYTAEPQPASTLTLGGRSIAPSDAHTAIYALRPDMRLEELPLDEASKGELLHQLSLRAGQKEKSADDWKPAMLDGPTMPKLSVIKGAEPTKLAVKNCSWKLEQQNFQQIPQLKAALGGVLETVAAETESQVETLKTQVRQLQQDFEPVKQHLEATGGSLAYVSRDHDIAYFVRLYADRPGYIIFWRVDPTAMLQPQPAESLMVDGRSIVPSGPGVYALRPDLRLERIPAGDEFGGPILESICQRVRTKNPPAWSGAPWEAAVFPQLSTVAPIRQSHTEVVREVPGTGKMLKMRMQAHNSWKAGPMFVSDGAAQTAAATEPSSEGREPYVPSYATPPQTASQYAAQPAPRASLPEQPPFSEGDSVVEPRVEVTSAPGPDYR